MVKVRKYSGCTFWQGQNDFSRDASASRRRTYTYVIEDSYKLWSSARVGEPAYC